MVQHSSIDHTGLTGVGTISYASNANSVASASAGGAATTQSRGDHVHLGVRSISHTSNTFSGPITFVAEGNLGITSPSTGTLAFKSISGAGGSSGSSGSLLSMDLIALWPSSASTATASESFSTTKPTHAFIAAEGTNGWLTNGTALPQWLRLQFPNAVICTSYALFPWYVDNYPGRAPKTWTFEGSNDGSSWTTLDTQTNYTAWASSTERTAFSFSNSTAYSYYRINISANQGNTYTGIGRMWLFGPVRIAQT